MLIAKNDEFTALSSIARDDVVVHRSCARFARDDNFLKEKGRQICSPKG